MRDKMVPNHRPYLDTHVNIIAGFLRNSNSLLQFPLTIIQRAHVASFEPTRDAVEVKGMLRAIKGTKE